MDRRILLATDGRDRSAPAEAYAIAAAEALGAHLEVVSVVDERLLALIDDERSVADLTEELHSMATSVVEAVTDRADAVSASGLVPTGRPPDAILAASTDADLLVLGRAIDPGPDPLTISARVIRDATVPVLSVPETADAPPTTIASALVPTDGSESPQQGLLALTPWLAAEATVHGLYVVDAAITELADAPGSIVGILREGGERALADLAGEVSSSARYRRHIRRGRVIDTVLEAIDELAPEVVAIGTRGRASGTDPILGSTTRGVLAQAPVPVLVAP